MPSSGFDTDVLIIGAGPTGLVLALWLTRLGVRVRIVDKTTEPGTTSRAIVVQARTLELYRQAGLADEVVGRGRKMAAINLWVAGKQVAHAVFGDMGADTSPFPYALVYPQDEHERFLIDRLDRLGVKVERQTELTALEEGASGMRAHLTGANGVTKACQASYIAGCDGAHSAVRNALAIDFPGGAYQHLFYVADVEARGAAMNGELHAALDTTDFLAVFPLKPDGPLKPGGRARLIGTVRAGAEHQHDLSWDHVSQRVIEWMHIDVERVNWFSTYHVHHRVAGHFRKGCAFLLGDAAHIHSPVGGQGMNTGIGDAVNLAWKLAAVLQRRADAAILDTYEPERIAFARRLVKTTDQAFTGVTSDGVIARQMRLNVVPFLLPPLFKLASVRRLMFRTISQTAVNYRGSALSDGRAGPVHGGDRLPWVKAALNGVEGDNFAPLTSLDWQVHVYGEAPPDLQTLCESRRLPLHVFLWLSGMGQKGLRRNAAYLLRPDGYVAMVSVEDSAAAIKSYLDRHKLIPM